MYGFVRNAGCILAGCVLARRHSRPQPGRARQARRGHEIAPSQSYGKLLSMMEQEFVSAVEAMPEDKFNFAPSEGEFKGVRTFAGTGEACDGLELLLLRRPRHEPGRRQGQGRRSRKTDHQGGNRPGPQGFVYQGPCLCRRHHAENAFVTMPNGSTRGGMAAFGIGPHDGPLRPAGRLPAHEWDRTAGQPRIDVIGPRGCQISVSVSLSEIPKSGSTSRFGFPEGIQGLPIEPGGCQTPCQGRGSRDRPHLDPPLWPERFGGFVSSGSRRF